MKIYKLNGSLDTSMNVGILQQKLDQAPSAIELEVSETALDSLDDIVGQALDYNDEDPTIPPNVVDEIIALMIFLGR